MLDGMIAPKLELVIIAVAGENRLTCPPDSMPSF